MRDCKRGHGPYSKRCKTCDAIKKRALRTKSSVRDANLRANYGISQADFEALMAAQDDKCAICGGGPGVYRHGVLVVDHDHETGRIRGLLCSMCNHGLGLFGDDSRRLILAARYLAAAKAAAIALKAT